MSAKILLLLMTVSLFACERHIKPTQAKNLSQQKAVIQLMEKHLNAVSNKDLASLAETLPPNGKMQLILPSREIDHTVTDFLDFHKEWFKDKSWSFETKILNSKVGISLAMVVVEIIYREPIRDGKPYFNRMTVSYVLEKIDGQWYVIKDHASSVQKSTDS